MSGKPGNRHSKFRKGKGTATGTGTGIGKRIEVGFKGRKKKDEINDHILLCDKTKSAATYKNRDGFQLITQ